MAKQNSTERLAEEAAKFVRESAKTAKIDREKAASMQQIRKGMVETKTKITK